MVMTEKHPDRTKEWAKQQEALKNPKKIPPKINEDPIKDEKKVNQ